MFKGSGPEENRLHSGQLWATGSTSGFSPCDASLQGHTGNQDEVLTYRQTHPLLTLGLAGRLLRVGGLV